MPTRGKRKKRSAVLMNIGTDSSPVASSARGVHFFIDLFLLDGLDSIAQLGRALRQVCGSGGTVHGTTIEVQGDQRPVVMAELERRGFRPVAAGG